MRSTVAKQFMTTVILVFILQVATLTFIFMSFYKSSVDTITELGSVNVQSQATMIENYLAKGRDILWLASESVDFMMEDGATNEEILDYLRVATSEMQNQYDENFTGIYGSIKGQYIDGSDWVPPSDYDPTTRDWYIRAIEGKGEMIITDPYIDAQTGGIVISFSQLLSDGQSVISMDIVLDEVQNNVENMSLNDIGYGFIVDPYGLIVAHSDISQRGKNYNEVSEEKKELLNQVSKHIGYPFEINQDGDKCTVFATRIEEDWDVVVVVSNTKLFADLRKQILVGVLLSFFTFLIILVFSAISVQRISRAEQQAESSHEKLERVNMSIIKALASTIDAKDRYTSGHSRRVAEYSLEIAKRLGMSEDEQRIVYFAGLLHDVGKIRVSEEVLNKKGALSEEEFDQIRIHPVSGFHILRDIHDDVRIGYGAKYHHERYDGKGYPNGLKGEDIPEISRIIAVADSYDAMSSDRSYRKALPQKTVRDEIIRGRGTQFDPKIADILLEMIDEDKEYYLKQGENKEKTILVIDDEASSVETIQKMLEDVSGIKVIGATNAEETMKVLEENDISMILLDLILPDIDGFDLYKRINEKYKIPVVLMTSKRSSDVLNKMHELKIDDYITKPLNTYIVRETVHGILYGGVT